MKLFENVFNLHEKALQLREQHLEVISRNIANVDTPNFKSRGIDFEEALEKALNEDHDEKQNERRDRRPGSYFGDARSSFCPIASWWDLWGTAVRMQLPRCRAIRFSGSIDRGAP